MLYDWEQFTILQKITFIMLSICILSIDVVLYSVVWVGQQADKIKKQIIDRNIRMLAKVLEFPLKGRF